MTFSTLRCCAVIPKLSSRNVHTYCSKSSNSVSLNLNLLVPKMKSLSPLCCFCTNFPNVNGTLFVFAVHSSLRMSLMMCELRFAKLNRLPLLLAFGLSSTKMYSWLKINKTRLVKVILNFAFFQVMNPEINRTIALVEIQIKHVMSQTFQMHFFCFFFFQ